MKTENSNAQEFNEHKVKFLGNAYAHCMMNRHAQFCRKGECLNCGNNFFNELNFCSDVEFYAILNRVQENLDNEKKINAKLSGKEETPAERKKRKAIAFYILIAISIFYTAMKIVFSDMFFFAKIFVFIFAMYGIIMLASILAMFCGRD